MITILMASYKGDTYLNAQIDSIVQQQGVDLQLLISDDFSESATTSLLAPYQEQLSFKVIAGPQRGVNANFHYLIEQANQHFPPIQSLLFAYADQDDVWLPQKLQLAQQSLVNLKQAAVYMGRTYVTDAMLNPLFLSKGKPRHASFQNALLESIAGGNTMVFNQQALLHMQQVTLPVFHDWLTYMVVSACGGQIIFDDTPTVLYRQHGQNLIGANKGLIPKLTRLKKLFAGEFRDWAENNICALTPLIPAMTPENKITFEGFVQLHQLQGWRYCFKRLQLFLKLGLYRQRTAEHIGFLLAAFLGKI